MTARGIKRTKRVAKSEWSKYKKLNQAQLSADAIRELAKDKAITPVNGIGTIEAPAEVIAELKTKLAVNAEIIDLSEKRAAQEERVKSLERQKKNIGAIGLSDEFRKTVTDLETAREDLERIENALIKAFHRAGREHEIA